MNTKKNATSSKKQETEKSAKTAAVESKPVVKSNPKAAPKQDIDPKAKSKEAKQDPKPALKTAAKKEPAVTKKSIIIEMVSKKGGATLDEIAQEIADRKIDKDLEKNKRVIRVWFTKLGFEVSQDKKSKKYQKS